jgi:hypothetical protein
LPNSILRGEGFSLPLSERMLAFSSRKTKNRHGGGSTNQPLPYLDPTISSPNAGSSVDLLKQNGLIVRPVIPRQSGGGFEQHAGGSKDQPLAYLDPTIPSPSAGPSADLLKQNGLIVRPAIERQSGGKNTYGGFLPSVMKGVVNSGVIVAPLAVMAAQRMMNGTRKRGGGKKENWAQNREAAKEELAKYGKPSALNVNKYAALKRKSEEEADEWLTGYILKKRKTAKKPKKVAKSKTEKASKANVAEVKTAALWKNLVERAKKDLEQYGKPSGANARKFASLHKKGLNTAAFLANYQTRKRYVAPAQVRTGRNTYKNNLQKAKQYLSTFGKPTATNLSKYVSLKRKGESVKAVENAVRSRVKPVTVKPSALKPTSRSPPPPNMEKMRKQLQLLKKKIKTYE